MIFVEAKNQKQASEIGKLFELESQAIYKQLSRFSKTVVLCKVKNFASDTHSFYKIEDGKTVRCGCEDANDLYYI